MNRLNLIFFITALVAANANAAFVLELDHGSGGIDQGPISAIAGSTIDLGVYLTQTGGETRLNDRSTGLDGAEFEVLVSDSTVLLIGSFTFGPRLVDNPLAPSNLNPTGSFQSVIDDSEDGFSGAVVSDDGVADNSLLLTTLQFNIASDAATGDYTITFTPTSFLAFALADATIGFPTPIAVSPFIATLNVTAAAVPEPSCCILLGIAVGGLSVLRRRRALATANL